MVLYNKLFLSFCAASLWTQQLKQPSREVSSAADLPGYCLVMTGCCCRTYLMYPFRGLFGGPLCWEVRHFTELMYVTGRILVPLQTQKHNVMQRASSHLLFLMEKRQICPFSDAYSRPVLQLGTDQLSAWLLDSMFSIFPVISINVSLFGY